MNRTVCNARTQSARMQRARLGAIVSTLSATISTLSANISTLISGLSARLLAALPKVACSRHDRSLSDFCAAAHGSMVGVGLGATRRSQLLAGLAVIVFARCTLPLLPVFLFFSLCLFLLLFLYSYHMLILVLILILLILIVILLVNRADLRCTPPVACCCVLRVTVHVACCP